MQSSPVCGMSSYGVVDFSLQAAADLRNKPGGCKTVTVINFLKLYESSYTGLASSDCCLLVGSCPLALSNATLG